MSDFLLSKWYLDCVAEDGTTFIGYAAILRWKAFSINFSNILTCRPHKKPHSEISLLKEKLPEQYDSTVNWNSDSFKMEGGWKGMSKPIKQRLYKSNDGEINWSCLLPLAKAKVKLGDLLISGTGYAEYMTITIVPWKLPITELRWGRFLTNQESLIWIDWKGKLPKAFVFYNGEEITNPKITDTKIIGNNDLHLSLARENTLRSGPLILTTLSKIPKVRAIFPKSILNTCEYKWLSKGAFLLNKTSASSGWAIHELVKFR